MQVEELIKKLAHEDSDVRNSAVQALGQIGKVADEVVPNLIQLLQNEDKDCRRVAARALGQAGEGAKDAVPDLIQLLQDTVRITMFVGIRQAHYVK